MTGASRRDVMVGAGLGAVGLGLAAAAQAAPGKGEAPVDTGVVQGGRVIFPPIHAATDPPDSPPAAPKPPSERIGFAVVGLGRLALEQIIPAFGEAKRARLTALVSGTPDKLRTVAGQQGVRPEACYGYADMERLRDQADVQVVYVVTPNAVHRRDVQAAAAAGKHVLTEKPMGASSDDARAMIEACRRADRLLMVAYRMQYEPHVREAIRMAREGELGRLRFIDAVNTQTESDPTQWRHVRALAGGGSLPDIGLYCLNTIRATLGEEPVEITASISTDPADPRFREVEDTVSFTMRFPSGVIANSACSYAAHQYRRFSIVGETGWVQIDQAFDYEGQVLRVARVQNGRETVSELRIPRRNQFALELDHMAECVSTGRRPRTSGEEGLQDHRLMEAIYQAARTRRPVVIPPVSGLDTTRGPEPSQQG